MDNVLDNQMERKHQMCDSTLQYLIPLMLLSLDALILLVCYFYSFFFF